MSIVTILLGVGAFLGVTLALAILFVVRVTDMPNDDGEWL